MINSLSYFSQATGTDDTVFWGFRKPFIRFDYNPAKELTIKGKHAK